MVPPEEIFTLPCDVFSPCAIGSVLNPWTIPTLRTRIVVGVANAQLLDAERDARLLHERGIVYVPDDAANSGAMIQVSAFLGEGMRSSHERIASRIGASVRAILERARETGSPPSRVAEEIARARLKPGKRRVDLYRPRPDPSLPGLPGR